MLLVELPAALAVSLVPSGDCAGELGGEGSGGRCLASPALHYWAGVQDVLFIACTIVNSL